jgi:hypothetical protein
MSGLLANVGKALVGRFVKQEGVKIAGRQIAASTIHKVAGGATLALAGKGALDVISPNAQPYGQYRQGAYAA